MRDTALAKLFRLQHAQGTISVLWGKNYDKLLNDTLRHFKAQGKLTTLDEAHIDLMYDKYQEIVKQAKEMKKRNDTI